MKIVNIDAPEHIAEKVVKSHIPCFVLEVVRPLEHIYYGSFCKDLIKEPHYINKLPLSEIRKFEDSHYENLAVLIHTIPIYLRDSRPEEIREENSIIDLLGAYFPNRNGDSPYIELYLSLIDNSVKNEQQFKWLFTKVLLHELAHAALDIFNQEDTANIMEKISYQAPFGRWREESMANAVALRIIKDYGNKDFYDYAKQFMLSQPAEYALGVLMENFGFWDFRSVFDGKIEGVNYDLQNEWLDYVNGNPDWEGLKHWNELLSSRFVYVFETNKYTSEQELVPDIVAKVLSDFETSNGRKMTYNEFKFTFPYIRTGAEMSYEKSDDVKDDSRFKFHIQLEDENCSLYYWWDNKTLHEFIIENPNVNIELKEYQNW